MPDLVVDTFPIWKAVAWIFYPMALLVAVELLLRVANDDDDDDRDGGKMVPAYMGA
tara:strand:- start:647 stop:814 length:168 start_codon:yes stop_codon:yes gene_type:complete